MITIETQKQFRDVANLPFCYWCGKNFQTGNVPDLNRDHVPPQNAFDVADRTPPLILKTHVACNTAHKTTDELIGQLVALQRNVTPKRGRHQLKMECYPDQSFGAVTNVNVVGAVWRYIRGFHTALYQKPLSGTAQRTITTPFTRGHIVDNELVLDGPNQGQHCAIVQTIKNQRALNNVDRIVSNNGKLTYECVWADDKTAVMSGQRPIIPRRACLFALDIYGWKDLGDAGPFPAHGCVGAYFQPDGHAPDGASLYIEAAPVASNQDPWAPFGP